MTAGYKPAYSGKDTPVMVICRNCRSSLPDGTGFCNICGYRVQIEELPSVSFSGSNVPYASPGYAGVLSNKREDEDVKLTGFVPGQDNASPTELLPYPVYGDHHQPLPNYGDHQQGLPNYGNHQQGLPNYGDHQQGLPAHADHYRGLPAYADHYQPIARNGFRPSYLIIGVSSFIIVSVIATACFFFFFVSGKNKPHTSMTTPSDITLVSSGKAVPSRMLQVIGSHLPDSQAVTV